MRLEYLIKVIYCREEIECSEDVIFFEIDENCEGEVKVENENMN